MIIVINYLLKDFHCVIFVYVYIVNIDVPNTYIGNI